MRKPTFIIAGALIAATSFAPAANAKHRHRAQHVVAAPATPAIDENGQFYATPVQTGAPTALPGLELIPGAGLAAGVGAPDVLPGLDVIPGLDAAGGIVNGITQPLLVPLS